MEITNIETVPDLIQSLIRIYLPNSLSQNICAYYLRLLSSHLKLQFSMNEEYTLAYMLKDLSLEDSDRLSCLYKKLKSLKSLKKKSEILYLFSQLKEENWVVIPLKQLEVIGSKPQDPTNQQIGGLIDFTRDALFAMQGIESRNFTYSESLSSFTINSSVQDSLYEVALKVTELGFLFKRITSFINKNLSVMNSVTLQSLSYSLKKQLNIYYKFLSLLDQNYDKKPSGLKKIWVTSQDALEKMCFLAAVCDGVEGLKGGEILSALYSYWRNGKENLKSFIRPVLEESAIPILNMIRSWMLEGELFDTYHEFFIVQDFSESKKKLWKSMFRINNEMVPCFFTEALTNKILLTGKSLYFLRKECFEEEWSETVPELHSILELDSQTLEGLWITRISKSTNEKLLNVLCGKYNLLEHCLSVKKYLLMNQGDFHHALMEGIHLVLNLPASKIYKHTLVSILETAIKSSNCQYHKPEYANRLRIILDDIKGKETGWDIFSLDYAIQSPLDTFFSDEIMWKYRKIFNFLWKAKRAQYLLNSFQYPKELIMIQGLKSAFISLRQTFVLNNQIQHFVNIFTNYLMVESIESYWDKFVTKLTMASDLDKLIEVHVKFVDGIMKNCFVSNDSIFKQVLRILDIIIRFTVSRENFLNSVKEEYARINSPIKEIYNDKDICRLSKESFNDIVAISNIFSEEVIRFNGLLNESDDLKLKNLVFIIDFNDFYSYEILRRQGYHEDDEFKAYTDVMKGLNEISRRFK